MTTRGPLPGASCRICKWGGLGLSIFLGLGWTASLTMLVIASYGRLNVAVGSGGIAFAAFQYPLETRLDLWGPEPIRWLPSVGVSNPRLRRSILFSAFIPFWCLLPGAVIPTVILWRRDRTFPPGHCQSCGYNLMGNATGVCPECGTAAY